MFAISPTPVGAGLVLATGIFSFPARTATATATLSNGTIGNVTLTDAGIGYSTAPAITVGGTGGSNGNVTATVANGSISALAIGNVGSGYSTITLTIAPPDGKYSKMTIPCPFRTVMGVYFTPLTVAGNDDRLVCNNTPVGNVINNTSIGSLNVERGGSNLTANLSFSVLIAGQ